MKTTILTLAIVAVLAAQIGFAKSPYRTFEQRVQLGVKNYEMALKSDNTGLLESGIILIAKMKIRIPNLEIENLQEQLAELTLHHPSATVRYKAHIASAICENPQWFAQSGTTPAGDDEQFFILAEHRLQEKLFGLTVY